MGRLSQSPRRVLLLTEVLLATRMHRRQAEEGTVSQSHVNGNVSSHCKCCFGRIFSIRDMVSFATREKEKRGPSFKKVHLISRDPHLRSKKDADPGGGFHVRRGKERVVFLLCTLPRLPNSLRDQTPRV